MDIKPTAINEKPPSVIAGHQLTGDLREIMLWLLKLPDDRRDHVIKMLRLIRGLMD